MSLPLLASSAAADPGGSINLGQAVVYGIVQGLTEFLPISSTAHLRIVPALAGWQDPGAAFTAVIQLGTVVAVVLYFWRELLHIIVAWFRGIAELVTRSPDRSARSTLEYRMGWYLILATVPVAVFGLVFDNQIETGARNLWIIAGAMIGLALVLIVAERIGKRNRGEEQITTRDAVAVGLAQAVSLVPGASRSGTTISAGLLRGLDRETAARFSFLLSIPAVVLSGLFEARKIGGPGGPGAGVTGVAVLFAFIVGLASIAWLLRWIGRHGTYVFIWYRIALGLALFGLLATNTISAT